MNPTAGSDEIDIVIPWVDGSDPAWRSARREAAGADAPDSFQYRDWGLMRYWFRGVEQNAPWVRKIHFITWGHLPPWLDPAHPRLHIVRHEDYLPEAYRPTFSSIPIELNVHRIGGLAEQFIVMNDDLFFLSPLSAEEYFREGLPCDALITLPITERCTDSFGHILWNNLSIINQHFTPAECAARHPDKWFSDAYTEEMRQDNRAACRWKHFLGFGHEHSANPMLKSVCEEVWREEKYVLEASSRLKFRCSGNVSNWLLRYWQLATGRFTPYVQEGRRYVTVDAPGAELRDAILSADTRVLCLNEAGDEFDFDSRAAYLRSLFERRLPEMSSFERF